MKTYIKRVYRKIFPKPVTWKEVKEMLLELAEVNNARDEGSK